MQKVLVAEIGSQTTTVNAFGDLNAENPRLLGQGLSPTTVLDGDAGIGLRLAVTDLEKDIGPVGLIGEIPFYETSSLEEWIAEQEGNGSYISPTSGAIMQAAQLIYEEVGDVLVIDVGDTSTEVYSVTLSIDKHQKSSLKPEPIAHRTVEKDLGVSSNAFPLVKLIGDNIIQDHHGQGWEKLLKSRPETAEEVALSVELTAAAITIALQRHSAESTINSSKDGTSSNVMWLNGRNSTRLRWIVGTGAALTQLPNALEIMRESIMGMANPLFKQEGIGMLLDRDCIMASMGILTKTYRPGAWQLLRESLGVEN